MNCEAKNNLEFYECWHRLSGPYIAWQFAQFREYVGSRVADVGCGLGNFVNLVKDRSLYIGLESDDRLAARVVLEHKDDQNVEIVTGRRSDITTPESVDFLIEKEIDTILSVNVLEHIHDDRSAVRNMIYGLRENGHLCVLVPAMPLAYGCIDEISLHHRRYSRKSLESLVLDLPLKILAFGYFNLVGGCGWFIKSRIFKVNTNSRNNFLVMNKMLPIVKYLEERIRIPFGLSLVLVGRKIRNETDARCRVNSLG